MEVSECKCVKCKKACSRKPGWFAPGEAEKAATFMGMDLGEFFRKYLCVDWWHGDGDGDGELGQTFVLSPAKIIDTPGRMATFDPNGRCVFFGEDGLCGIYPARPLECAAALMCGPANPDLHLEVARTWATPEAQKQIEELLGYPAEEPAPDLTDLFSMLRAGGFAPAGLSGEVEF